MSKKAKFKPEIKRIQLNPEQAVLSCAGYNTRNHGIRQSYYGVSTFVHTCVGRRLVWGGSGTGTGFAAWMGHRSGQPTRS